jgi:septin family protein
MFFALYFGKSLVSTALAYQQLKCLWYETYLTKEYALQHLGMMDLSSVWKIPVAKKTYEVDSGSLGVECLPDQIVRQVYTRKNVLNLMVVGESGLGKTSFINTLFSCDILKVKQKTLIGKTTEVIPYTVELEENEVTLLLTVVDTPGFGDSLNREEGFKPIFNYIDSQYEKFLQSENSLSPRPSDLPDTRIHALLYFISPNGHGLKDLDISFLKILSSKANVIPIISKGDSFTESEMKLFKERILNDLSKYDIKTYPSSFVEDRDAISHLEKHIPFSVIGSPVNKKRIYKWGTAEGKLYAH